MDERRYAVVDIKRGSLHDGPGLRSTVFLKGCALDCGWCQNPEARLPRPRLWWFADRCQGCSACVSACTSQALRLEQGRIIIDHGACSRCGDCLDACPHQALALDARWMSACEILDEVESDRVFYRHGGGGMTLSGGDPLYDPAAAGELLSLARARGLHTAVETCLHAATAAVERLAPLVDHWLIDLKIADDAAHRHWTGAGNALIHANLRRLHALGAEITLRIPLIPGATADAANLDALGDLVAALDPGLPVEVLDFNPLPAAKYRRLGQDWAFAHIRPQGPSGLAAARARLRERGLTHLYGDSP